MNLEMKYRHLNDKDRAKISRMKGWGYSYSKIARKIGVDKSTISRELRRNGYITDRDLGFWKKLYLDLGLFEEYERIKDEPNSEKYLKYETKRANQLAANRKKLATKRNKIAKETADWIEEKLKGGWTPEQVAGRSKKECGQSISHETIYQIVLRDKRKGGKLYRHLPRFGKRKQRGSPREYRRELIPNRVGIEDRPAIVKERSRLGDLEGDLIVGSKQESYLATVVDRTSRQVSIEPLKRRDRESVRRAFIAAIKRMPVAHTLTLDNAMEFSCHTELTLELGIKVYFSNPYASYERGTVENTNGIIRRTYPKRTDFNRVTLDEIRELEKRLNSTPRKVLGYLTAKEVVRKYLETQRGVALRT